ncbi:hypothetical protein ACHAXA_010523 [Cyclostephanos tholiformis]|uniref:Uncharacterized protein n=1 Tax=Cyclostephanos tholiformis TaxID=382380 RepID=A0ABD3SQ59_9STRA
MEDFGCRKILQDAGECASPNSKQIRVRPRGQSSSVSSSSSLSPRGWAQTKTGRHVTNIHKINVINNFGMDRDKRVKDNMSWVVLRIVVALLMTIWFGALVCVIRGAVLPPSPVNANSIVEVDSSRVDTKSKDLHTVSLDPKVVAVLKKMKNDSSRVETTSKDMHSASLDPEAVVALKKSNLEATESHSIFDLSLFGNKSPSDFQLYTPHAPSCSEPLEAQEVSFTLVSQLSDDRLWMVKHHCERWGNKPMSIVVFTDRTAADVKSGLISQGCSGESLTLQTVKKTQYDPAGTEYPVNLLRNLAMSAVKTSHILYADVDFWPSTDLYPILSNETIKDRLASDSKIAAIIPVFQMLRMCREYRDCREANIPRMPKHKKGLLWLIERHAAFSFDPTNRGGHGSTKYKTWRKQETATFVDLPCIKSNRYEPYLVLRYCSELPPFQEGFTGYGKNKMTWAMQLRKVGYKFSQIGGAFLVHYPHLDSKSREEWNKKPEVFEEKKVTHKKVTHNLIDRHVDEIVLSQFKRARVDALFLDFKRWLNENIEDDSRTPMCQDAQNDDYTLWVLPSKKEGNADSEDVDNKGDVDGEYVEDSANNDSIEKNAGAEERLENMIDENGNVGKGQ